MKEIMKSKLIYQTVLLALTLGLARQGVGQDKGTILIKNGTVLTVTKGTLENTDVLIRDGKINQIGKGLKAPGGAKEIDATGLFVMPESSMLTRTSRWNRLMRGPVRSRLKFGKEMRLIRCRFPFIGHWPEVAPLRMPCTALLIQSVANAKPLNTAMEHFYQRN